MQKTPTERRIHKKIIIAVVIKLGALWLLWWLCFSHPTDHTLQATHIAQHLLQE